MSKKIKRHITRKRHITGKRYITGKRHIVRKKNKKTTKRHLYRKRRDILTVPGSQGVPLFSTPENKSNQKIYVNKYDKQSGNMIPGMREM